MAGSLREALTEAYDDLEAGGDDGPRPRTIEPIVADDAVGDLPSGGDNEIVVPEEGVVEEEVVAAQQQTPARKKPEQLTRAKPAAQPSQQGKKPDASAAVIEQQVAKAGKAPQSWKPALREKFGKLAPDIQSEIL